MESEESLQQTAQRTSSGNKSVAHNTTQQYERIGPKCVSGSNVARRDVCPLQAGPKRSTTLIVTTVAGYDPYPVQYGLQYQNQGCAILGHQIVVVTIFFFKFGA